MFNSYEMTKAFVTERQETLRHEARQHRLAKGRRRGRGATPSAPAVRLAASSDPVPTVGQADPNQLAA
jgi:hypothetical protein